MNENLLNSKNFKMFGSKQMESIAKKIKIVVFDFDGVFTDNSVYTTEDGKEIIKNSKYDSMGISKANRRQNFLAITEVVLNSSNFVTTLRLDVCYK